MLLGVLTAVSAGCGDSGPAAATRSVEPDAVSTPTASPAQRSADCGELTADVPADLSRTSTVEEIVDTGPAGGRVTYGEPSLRRELSLITGSEPVAFDHGEPTGTVRSETTVMSQPATQVVLPNGDRFVYWEDPSAVPGCEGRQVAMIGFTEEEAERVLTSLAVSG